MPIGIFLFALKSDYQKSEKNGVKVIVTLRVLRIQITAEPCMKSAAGGMSSARKGCMESTRSVVCYQAEGFREENTLTRDAILRGAQITYTPKGRDYMPILRIG